MKKSKAKTFELFSKYRTLLMGFATLSVVFFHFASDRATYHYGYEGIYKIFNHFVSSSGVDIFLFLSGLGLYYSWEKNSNYKEFLKKRLPRILLPYFIICIPALLWRDIFFLDQGFIEFFKDFLFISFFQSGKNWFWYICFITICYVIFPYLFEMIDSCKKNIEIEKTLLNIFTTVTVVGLLLYHFANPYFGNTNIMLLRIPSFIFGIYLGKLSYNKEKITGKWLFVCILALLVMPLRSFNKLLLNRYVVALGALASLFIIIYILEFFEEKGYKLKIVRKFIEFFGKYSLEIYLLHVTVRTILNSYGLYTARIRYELLMVGITIILSIIVHYIVEIIQRKLIK